MAYRTFFTKYLLMAYSSILTTYSTVPFLFMTHRVLRKVWASGGLSGRGEGEVGNCIPG